MNSFVRRKLRRVHSNWANTLHISLPTPHHRSITRAYYRNSVGGLLLFDITNRRSFQNVHDWLEEARSHVQPHSIVFLLVGHKCDLEAQRQVCSVLKVKCSTSDLWWGCVASSLGTVAIWNYTIYSFFKACSFKNNLVFTFRSAHIWIRRQPLFFFGLILLGHVVDRKQKYHHGKLDIAAWLSKTLAASSPASAASFWFWSSHFENLRQKAKIKKNVSKASQCRQADAFVRASV